MIISDNIIHHNTTYGIYGLSANTYASRTRLIMSNNTIYDSGTGIYCYRQNSEMKAEITGNEIYNSTDGIYLYSRDSYTLEAVISGNDVHDNSNRGIYGSKDATREAFKLGLIKNGEIWMDMIQSRNKTSHTYNQEVAQEIVAAIETDYFGEFTQLHRTLTTLKAEEQSEP